jgi:hypothetical protein
MDQFRKLFIFLLSGFLFNFLACKKGEVSVPDEIIPPEQMAEILLELSIVDGAQNVSFSSGSSIDFKQWVFYNEVLKKHDITKDSLMRSMEWYADNVKVLMKVFDKAVFKLDSLRNDLSRENL